MSSVHVISVSTIPPNDVMFKIRCGAL